MYFLQNSLYLSLVRHSRAAQRGGTEEVVLRVEPLEFEGSRAVCRVLGGGGELVMVNFGGLGAGGADFEAASELYVTVDANARQFSRAKNFGFDYDKYLFSRGISAQFYAKDASVAADGFSISKLRRNLRGAIARRIEDYGLGGLLNALVLGDKDDFDLYAEMKDLGISHLLVISGLHFSIIHGAVAAMTNIFGNKYVRAALVVLAMSFVLFIVKSSYSAERAFFSMLYCEAARLVDRRTDTLTAQSFAVGMILLRTPAAVLNTGFHLSIYTYFAIAFLYRRLAKSGSVPFWEILKFSVYVQFAGLPVTCFLFGRINLFSAVANILCVPLFALVVPLAFATVILAPVGIVRAVWLFFDGVLYSLIKISPLQSIGISFLYFDVFIAFVLIISLAFVFKKLYSRKFLIPLIAVACIIPAWHSGSEIVSFDVCHGDATLVRHGALTCLIDTGDGRTDIAAELRALGITKLDIVVITHFHDDHYGGLQKLLQSIEAEYIYLTEATGQYLSKLAADGFADLSGKKIIVVGESQRITASKGGSSAVFDFYRLRSAIDENDNGICVSADIEGQRCLFFGDASSDSILSVIAAMGGLESCGQHRAAFMKAAHHGSKTSSSPAVFSAAGAEMVSVSHSKKYAMPSKAFLDASADLSVHSTYYSGCAIYRLEDKCILEKVYIK